MADEARCTPLHPENMDATCSDVRELLAPTSFHVVHGGCASVLNVDKALIGQLSPLGKLSPTIAINRDPGKAMTQTGLPSPWPLQ